MAQPTAQQASPAPAAAAPQPWRLAAAARQDLPGLEWAPERRASALTRLDESGLPHTDQEDWRHTSLAAYVQRWMSNLTPVTRPATPAAPLPDDATVSIGIVDGVLQSPAAQAVASLRVYSLRSAAAEARQAAAELLRHSAALPPDSLVDLNTALLEDVVVIATAAGAAAELPVHVRMHGTGPALAQPRLLVDVAPGSRLTLVLEHTGAEGTLCNAVTEAWVGPGAQLTLVRVQALPDDGMLTETTRIELGADATLGMTSVDLGGELARQTVSIALAGPGASATVDGLFLADGHRHIDNLTRLEHRATGTTSRESFRGIADGHGHGIFNGKIIVQPGAAGSNAALTNRNLLLSATAEIDTKPELEIYVDDVRCSHGATTGQLDANALFYLRSRGLDPAAARQVLTAAFLREGLASIALPGLRARLEAQLQARLGGELAIAGPGTGPTP